MSKGKVVTTGKPSPNYKSAANKERKIAKQKRAIEKQAARSITPHGTARKKRRRALTTLWGQEHRNHG